jgi:hypothetical protein
VPIGWSWHCSSPSPTLSTTTVPPQTLQLNFAPAFFTAVFSGTDPSPEMTAWQPEIAGSRSALRAVPTCWSTVTTGSSRVNEATVVYRCGALRPNAIRQARSGVGDLHGASRTSVLGPNVSAGRELAAWPNGSPGTWTNFLSNY